MLKRRAVHKDMAEANVYAARRLKDMAQSLLNSLNAKKR